MTMNDPHVQALHYDIKHAGSVGFDRATPLEHEEPNFSVRIESCQATVVMKTHHSVVESARAVVDPFLRVWELSSALFSANDKFEFSFQHGDIIDRKPTPGIVDVGVIELGIATDVTLDANVSRGSYPSPPIGLARDAFVDFMLDRYRMYWGHRTTLSDAANFCLTVLEFAAGNRKKAAAQFATALVVLNTLGRLSAEKGGREGRKARAARSEYTAAERVWLEETIKKIIRRAAEVAYNSTVPYQQITMADLPPLP